MFSTGLQGTDFFLVLLSAALVNNVVTTQFLGLCPFLGVSARMDSALGLGAATSLVLLVSVAIAFGLDTLILTPLDAHYLRTIAFIFRSPVRCNLWISSHALCHRDCTVCWGSTSRSSRRTARFLALHFSQCVILKASCLRCCTHRAEQLVSS